MLLGRVEELAAIDALIADAHAGNSRTVVLAGAPGIGKSALLRYAADAAGGMHVTRVAGTESELDLAFAGLHRLLRPFLGMREALPEPQRAALGAAFGLTTSAPPDRFLVGLATLTLLADTANEQPLVCIVDDAQWIDHESIEVITFVARRLQAERIAVLFGIRVPAVPRDPLDGFERLTMQGLADADAEALLVRSARTPPSAAVIASILAEALGNPLALEEIGRELSPEQATGTSPLPDPLPVGPRLETAFLHQSRGLSHDAQTLLVIAAAETFRDPDTVRRAARALDVSTEAYDAVERAGLMTLRSEIEFRHPLIRSAVYTAADPALRRSAHRALAEATDREHNPERRAVHLAASQVVPDETIAAELEDAAVRARRRGGNTAAASLLTRAADLSTNPAQRAARLLDAAEAARTSGDPWRAKALLDRARPDASTDRLRATGRRLEGLVKAPMAQPALGPAILLDAARAFTPIDRSIARATFLEALDNYLISYSLTQDTTGAEIAQAAFEFLDDDADAPTIEHFLLEAAAHVIGGSGFAAAVPSLRRVVEALHDAGISGSTLMRSLFIGPLVTNHLYDDEAFRTLASRLAAIAREQGALWALQIALLSLADFDMTAGRFARAREHHAELLDVTALIGHYVEFYALLDVELIAWRGDDKAARTKAAILEEPGTAIGTMASVYLAWQALTVLDLAQGNYREAFERTNRATASDTIFTTRALPDVVEAATRCGEDVAAGGALAALRERAVSSGTPLARGLYARCEALVTEGGEAESLYVTAIDLLGTTHYATALARAHLLYGEWLRRENRRLDAREQLRTAHDMFTTMGAEAFAQRARVELAATGEHARKRTVESINDLTPQEAQIARLAAERITSREIGAQLFISSKTVEYHLGKVFRKLGVSSRRDLPAALTSTTR